MLLLILVLLLLFGGGGYYAYGPAGGIGIGGVILISCSSPGVSRYDSFRLAIESA
jgi:hypothetical protein